MGSDKRFDFREQPKGFLELLLKLSGRRGPSPTPSETSLESEPFSDQLEQFISPSRQESHESEISKVVMKNHEYRGRIDSQRDYWMRDDNVKECYDCKIPFSTFKRRHHCRCCGLIFCHKCASSIVSGQQFGYQGDVRVCNYCLKVVDYYNKEKRSQDENCKLNVPSLSSSFEQLGKMLNPRIYSPTDNLPLRYDAPFRNQKNPEYQLDPENGTSLAEEEYAGLTGTSYRALKSFVKVRGPTSVEAEASMLQENRKSSSVGFSNFVTRRKFSTRGMGRYIGQTSFNATEGDGDQPGHFRSVSSAINVDINAASITHVKRLVRQMLIDEMISNIEAWHEVIIKILLTICKSINPDVRNGDEIDVRNYIKIKKIPGGSIAESHYVNGVVATKRALHKKMLKPVQNPKILLITFPLEYQRVQGEYLSLEPVLSQEREHLKNLVGRLIALKPDVIMVEKTVARVALEYLLDQNIIVIQNVKSNVLSAVARCSKAEIIHSIDKLSPKGLGLCKEFCFKTYHNNSIPGIRKSYLFVQGCNDELGCTIVLRGDKMNTLKKIKGIVDFVAFVVYSLKLETCLFQDQYAKVPTVTEDLAEKKIADNLSDLEVAVKRFESKILSGSPNVKYPLPHVVLRLLEQEKKNSMVADHKSITSKKSDLELVSRKIDLLSLSNDNTSVKEQVQIPNMKAPDLDMLSPFTEQNLFVMYSNICINSTVPCISPFPHFIYFYSDSDMTLGQYIEDSCYSSKFDCPVKSCEQPMLSHYRSYVHAEGRVTVSVDSLPCPMQGMENRIMMWSLCRVCQESGPFIPMSEETWKYSFGKYLELTFYHEKQAPRTTSCTHDIHREHCRFFAFRNITLRFQYESIELFDICGPPMHRVPKSESLSKLKQKDMEKIRDQIVSFYDSVLDRIELFTYEIVAPYKVSVAKEHMSELSTKAHMEKKLILQLLHQNYVSSDPTDCNSLNIVYKNLLENVLLWDTEFQEFIRVHLQPESRDIRKITASQIKRIFLDKDVTAENRNTQFAVADIALLRDPENFGVIDKAKLPKLFYENTHELVEEYFTPSLKREISLTLMNSSMNFPKVLASPSLSPTDPNEGIEFVALGADENNIPLKPIPTHFHPEKSKVSPIEEESETAVATDGLMYPRHFFTRSRAMFEVSSSESKEVNNRNTSLEDEQIVEFNTITGVAAEAQIYPRSKESTAPSTEARSTSLMKTITKLWNGNLANFRPLVVPTSPLEHIFPDSSVIVRENEVSSIVAFSLTSTHYLEKLQAMRDGVESKVPPSHNENNKYSIGFDDNPTDLEESLLRDKGTHIRYEFYDGQVKFHCKIYFAEQFDALRKNCGISGMYEQSLSRCAKWDTSGGKSNSAFMKTRDDWLVVKNISPIELEALASISPAYFEYMSQAFFHELPTVLAKIFGFYQISFKNPATRKTVKMDIVVMENLFYERPNISRIFDLKGSVRNRHVQSTGKQNEVLLDNNLLEFIYDSPLFIREHSKKIIRSSVYNDTLFLSRLNVMDYSLLVGIDNESNELVVGIVDFIRTFTWDKKLESWVKETGILGGGGKEPTIVTPKQYKNRFREAMEKYFLMVPEKFISANLIEIEQPVVLK